MTTVVIGEMLNRNGWSHPTDASFAGMWHVSVRQPMAMRQRTGDQQQFRQFSQQPLLPSLILQAIKAIPIDWQIFGPRELMSSRKSTKVVIEADLEVVEIADNLQTTILSDKRDDPRPSADSVASFPLIEPYVVVNSRGLPRHASSPALGSGQLYGSDNTSTSGLPPLSGADGVSRRNRDHLVPLSRRQQSNASDVVSTARDSSTHDTAEFLSSDVDWYGNSSLHQIFARSPVDLATLSALLQAHPHLARLQNQFGRLPLHYALDRSRVNEAGVRMLLAAFPAAAAVRDHQGQTPYDLALRWQHSRSMLRVLLESCPDIDKDAFMRMKYGPLGSLAVWASSLAGKKSEEDDNAAVAEAAAPIAPDASACSSLPSIYPPTNDVTQSCQTQSHSIFTDYGSREHTPRAMARAARASPRPCIASDDDRVVTFTAE